MAKITKEMRKKMRARLSEELDKRSRSGRGGGSTNWEDSPIWKPAQGEKYAVRFVPPKSVRQTSYEDWLQLGDLDVMAQVMADHITNTIREKHVHWDVPGIRGSVLCLKRNGYASECPVCEFGHELWVKATEADSDKGREMAKNFFVKQRWYSLVYVEGDDRIRWWDFGYKMHQEFLEAFQEEETEWFTDMEQGAAVRVYRADPTGGRRRGVQKWGWPPTGMKRGPIVEDEGQLQELLSTIVPFDEAFGHRIYDADMIQKCLDRFKAGDDPEKLSSETSIGVAEKVSGQTAPDAAFAEIVSDGEDGLEEFLETF